MKVFEFIKSMIPFIVKSTCVRTWYMHVGPHVAGICICTCVKIRGILLWQCLPYSLTESLTELVARCAPTPLLACSDESPEILLFLLLVLLPKPFLLPGIEVWEATLIFYMEPRVPNLCSKHSYLLCCFPSPRAPFNYKKINLLGGAHL